MCVHWHHYLIIISGAPTYHLCMGKEYPANLATPWLLHHHAFITPRRRNSVITPKNNDTLESRCPLIGSLGVHTYSQRHVSPLY
jgi:hypothetical protein